MSIIFRPSDWGINKFLWLVIGVQFAVIGLAYLATCGIEIPIARQAIGFVYLTFIPGIIILRILKLHELETTEIIIYSVGLSLAFTMFVGLSINTILPLVGISHPISNWPITISLFTAVLLLTIIAYIRDRGYRSGIQVTWADSLLPSTLILVLLPVVSILGSLLVNIYHSNIVLMILICLIALAPIIVIFTNLLPQRLFPLAVFMISLSLLYHRSLISNYLTGWDVHLEYYFANLVNLNAVWDTSIPNSFNHTLSIVILSPVYSIICNLELTSLFKIVSPILFSLVPLGIYQICKKQINTKVAFLTTFFFMAVIPFFSVMISMIRQQVAEIFMVLLILLIIDKTAAKQAKRVIFIIFGFGLIVSHYSVAFIIMFAIVASLLIYFLISRFNKQLRLTNETDWTLTTTFGVLFVVATLSWYMYQAGSPAINAMIIQLENVTLSMITEFINIGASEPLSMITRTGSPLHEVAKYLQIFMQFFIAIGIFSAIRNWHKKEYDHEYVIFSLVFLILAIIAIFAPYVASSINTSRLYHITLIVLSPYCITGAIFLYRLLARKDRTIDIPVKVVSVLLTIFLLFTTGFIYEISNDDPSSISISQHSIINSGTADFKVSYYNNMVPEEEIRSAIWLSQNCENRKDIRIYGTYSGMQRIMAITSYGMIPLDRVTQLSVSDSGVAPGSYIYLRYINVVEDLGIDRESTGLRKSITIDMSVFDNVLANINKIYSNGGSAVLYKNPNNGRDIILK